MYELTPLLTARHGVITPLPAVGGGGGRLTDGRRLECRGCGLGAVKTHRYPASGGRGGVGTDCSGTALNALKLMNQDSEILADSHFFAAFAHYLVFVLIKHGAGIFYYL